MDNVTIGQFNGVLALVILLMGASFVSMAWKIFSNIFKGR